MQQIKSERYRGRSCRAYHSSACDFEDHQGNECRIRKEALEVSWEIPIFRGVEKEKHSEKETRKKGRKTRHE